MLLFNEIIKNNLHLEGYSIIDDIEITTEDKVKFIVTMSNINGDTPTNEIYKLVGTLPNNIQKLIDQ